MSLGTPEICASSLATRHGLNRYPGRGSPNFSLDRSITSRLDQIRKANTSRDPRSRSEFAQRGRTLNFGHRSAARHVRSTISDCAEQPVVFPTCEMSGESGWSSGRKFAGDQSHSPAKAPVIVISSASCNDLCIPQIFPDHRRIGSWHDYC
jgi:hypothetical protein